MRISHAFNRLQSLAVAALVLGVIVTTAGCEKSDAARTVVLYTSADQVYAQQVVNAFMRKYPDIRVQTRYDSEATKTTGLVEALRAQAADPVADVFWSSEPFLTQKLAEEGLFTTIDSAELTDWPKEYRDPDQRWYGFACRARVIAYNPERTTDVPATWLELADEKYKNKIVLADPNFGTTRGHIASFFTLWGAPAAEQFLRDLEANGVRIVKSNSQAVRDVAAGLAQYAVTDTDDVFAAQRNGATLSFVAPRSSANPDLGTLLIPNTVSLVANRPDNPDAMLLVEFLLSPRAQRLLYQSDSHNLPILPPGVDPGVEIQARHRIDDAYLPSIAKVSSDMPVAIQAANRILLSPDR